MLEAVPGFGAERRALIPGTRFRRQDMLGKLRNLLRRSRLERDLDDELRFQLENQIEQNVT